MDFLLQWNVGGLLSHLSEFKQYIQKEAPLLAAIQETHFKSTDHYNYNVAGYTLYRQDINLANRQGGVALYVANSVSQRKTNIASPLNVVAATVSLLNRELLVVSVYLPPNATVVNQQNLNDLLEQMPENCLLLGDFNGHSPLWGSRHLSPRGRIIEAALNLLRR